MKRRPRRKRNIDNQNSQRSHKTEHQLAPPGEKHESGQQVPNSDDFRRTKSDLTHDKLPKIKNKNPEVTLPELEGGDSQNASGQALSEKDERIILSERPASVVGTYDTEGGPPRPRSGLWDGSGGGGGGGGGGSGDNVSDEEQNSKLQDLSPVIAMATRGRFIIS